jgi:hypothetical protein
MNKRTDFQSGAKNHWRRWIWNGMRDSIDPKRATALLMPGRTTAEIEMALTKGIRRKNLIIVDYKPAIVATHARRFPGIQTYGCSLGRAAWRMMADGITVDAASLDFMSCWGEAMWFQLSALLTTGVLRDGTVVSINMLRGREKQDATYMIDTLVSGLKDTKLWQAVPNIGKIKPTERDYGRLDSLLTVLYWNGYWAMPVRVGIYSSVAGSQTMLWAVFRLETIDQEIGPSEHQRLIQSVSRAIVSGLDMKPNASGEQVLAEIDRRLDRNDKIAKLMKRKFKGVVALIPTMDGDECTGGARASVSSS